METEQTALALPETFDEAGWRLDRFEFLNWGTFNARVYVLRAEMLSAVITGPNESGKSTIIDGLATLITPPQQRAYNMASGTEKHRDRKEDTYIHGVFGESSSATGVRQLSLRTDGTPTALLLVLRNADSKACLSVGRICWSIDHEPNGFFFLAEKDVAISKDLPSFDDTRTLETRVGKVPGIETFGNSHRKMALQLTKLLGIDINALILFGRVISVRQTGEVNSFIRDHMLDAFDVRDSVDNLFQQFAKISEIRQAVDRAQQQISKLQPVADRLKVLESRRDALKTIIDILDSAKTFFPMETERLALARRDELSESLRQAQSMAETAQNASSAAQRTLLEAKEAMGSSSEARQLKGIMDQITSLREAMAGRQHVVARFIKALQAAELRLSGPLTEARFSDLTAKAERETPTVLGQADQALGRVREIQSEISNLERDIAQMRADVAELSNRSGRIRGDLALARRAICQEIHVSEDTFPFAAELMDVQDTAEIWRQSLEILLNGLGRSILVPQKHYDSVVQFVRRTKFRDLKLVFLEAEYLSPAIAVLEPEDRGRVLSKLRFKPHDPLIGWLAKHIRSHFRHVCCETHEQFRAERYAITSDRLVRSGVFNIKDDRDFVFQRDSYILGWQNENLRETLRDQIEGKIRALVPLKEEEKRVRGLREQYDKRRMALHDVTQFRSFTDLDSSGDKLRVDELEAQHARMLTSSDKLRELQNAVTLAGRRVDETQKDWEAATGKVAVLQSDITKVGVRIALNKTRLGVVPAGFEIDDARARMRPFAPQEKWDLDGIADTERVALGTLHARQNEGTEAVETAAAGVRRAMTEFLADFPDQSLSMRAEEGHAAVFLELLKRLQDEDLPRHRERLREMMGKFTQHDLSTLQHDLRDQVRKDKDMIRALNATLREIGYADNSYIEIKADDASGQVQKFKAELADCLSYNINAGDDVREKAFEAARQLIEKLKVDKVFRDTVTDTRKWLTFVVREKDRITDEEVNVFSTSAGRSGGGRTKLAFTILAASIAKQYGLLGPDKRNTFRLVVVDEMFGVTDERYSRYALDLFHRFGLQLICVTPLSPSARVVDSYAHTFHLVTKPDGKHSTLTTITAERLEKERARTAT
jgi:uncharacterized protein YPO0396